MQNLRMASPYRSVHSTFGQIPMSPNILRKKTARVATVRMNETVAIAAQLMRSSNISALVVKDVVRTEGNTAVGMFTERDVVRAIAQHGAAGAGMRVSQFVAVQQLVSCTSTDTLEYVRHLMNKHHIRHVPVIDNYSLIGVVSKPYLPAFTQSPACSAAPGTHQRPLQPGPLEVRLAQCQVRKPRYLRARAVAALRPLCPLPLLAVRHFEHPEKSRPIGSRKRPP